MFPTDRDGENDEEQEQTGGGRRNIAFLRRIKIDLVHPEPIKQHVCFWETQPVTCRQTDLCTIPKDWITVL